jgi:rare lipoprotein A
VQLNHHTADRRIARSRGCDHLGNVEPVKARLPQSKSVRVGLGRPGAWESVLKLELIFLLAAAIQLVPGNITGALADGQTGIASIYSTESGSRTASGRRLDPGALTAAHRSLPFGSKVRVTNRSNGRSVVVTVIDRGPFVRGRIIDVTPAAARALGFSGTTPVTLDHE